MSPAVSGPGGASVTGRPVLLSTSSVYPEGSATAFDLAERLGYDGVEVMIWTDPVTQEPGALQALADLHAVPVRAVHAPTLLLSQRVWGWEPWAKVDRSVALATELGVSTVVVHPPFRWQREYAAEFVAGVARREADTGVRLAVENMFPWRAGGSEMQAYLPHWDPVDQPYDHVTLDVSHAATSGLDLLAAARRLRDRIAHVHLADGSGSFRDEHLVPGRGGQPVTELLELLAELGYAGDLTVEVSTRGRTPQEREADLAEALAVARGQPRLV